MLARTGNWILSGLQCGHTQRSCSSQIPFKMDLLHFEQSAVRDYHINEDVVIFPRSFGIIYCLSIMTQTEKE